MFNRFRGLLISILCLSLIFGLISGPIQSAHAAPLPTAEKVKKKIPSRPSKGSKVEIPEWRTANSKHFLKDDGSFEMEVSKESIFFQDSVSKQWKNIDNTLVSSAKEGFAFKNKANRFDVHFPHTTGNGAITRFTLEDASIEFYPMGLVPGNGVAQGNQLSYKEASKHMDIRYTVDSDRLKEEIILKAADAPTAYSYELKLNNLNYRAKADGSIEFRFADSSRFAFVIPKPFMFEAGDMPQISDKVTQTIRKAGNQLFLDISADSSWINGVGRKFPVTIDPTIDTRQDFFIDTFASSTNPTTNYAGYSHVYAGTTASHSTTRSTGGLISPL